MIRYILLVFCMLCHQLYADEGNMNHDLEKWFNEDIESDSVQSSDGNLIFLHTHPQKPSFHLINNLTVNKDSIETGWVMLEQCYKHLDPVADTEVEYRYRFMRKLMVSLVENIERADIEGQSVRLINVAPKAQLCVTAEVRILNKTEEGYYKLINGPFHRKFLDGYFPYHLTMQVNYPASLLNLKQITPQDQAGFAIKRADSSLPIDSYFTGMLTIEIIFQRL